MSSRIFKKHGIGFENYVMHTGLDNDAFVYDETATDEQRYRDFDDVVEGIGVAFETLDFLSETRSSLRAAGPGDKSATKLAFLAIETAQRHLNIVVTKPKLSAGTETLEDRSFSVAEESIGEIIKAIIDSIKETFTSLWEWITSFFESEGREKAKEKADNATAAAESSLTGEAPKHGTGDPNIVRKKIVAYADLPEESKKQAIETLSKHLEHFKFLLPNPTVDDLKKHIDECVKRTEEMMGVSDRFEGIEDRLIRQTEDGIRAINQGKLDMESFKKGTQEHNKEIENTLAKSGRPVSSKKVKDALSARAISGAEGSVDFVAQAKIIFNGADSQQLILYCPPSRNENHPKFLRMEAFPVEDIPVTDQACISLESTREAVLMYIGAIWVFRVTCEKFEKKLKDTQKKSKAVRDKVLKNFQTLEANAKASGEDANRDALFKEMLAHLRHQCAIFGKTSADLVKAANLISTTRVQHSYMSSAVVQAFGMKELDPSDPPAPTNPPQPPEPTTPPAAPTPQPAPAAPAAPTPAPPDNNDSDDNGHYFI